MFHLSRRPQTPPSAPLPFHQVIFRAVRLNPFTCKWEYFGNADLTSDAARFAAGHSDGDLADAFAHALPHMSINHSILQGGAYRTFSAYFNNHCGSNGVTPYMFISTLAQFAPGFVEKASAVCGRLRGVLTVVKHDGTVKCYTYCGVGDAFQPPPITVNTAKEGESATTALFHANLMHSIKSPTHTLIQDKGGAYPNMYDEKKNEDEV